MTTPTQGPHAPIETPSDRSVSREESVREALNTIDVHEEAGDYEFRGDGDYTPNEFEQQMLEDFGLGLMMKAEDALSRARSAPGGEGVERLGEEILGALDEAPWFRCNTNSTREREEVLRHTGPDDYEIVSTFRWKDDIDAASAASEHERSRLERTTRIKAITSVFACAGRLPTAPSGGDAGADEFGAHILDGVIGYIGDREVGPGHVVLSADRYQMLLEAFRSPAPAPQSQPGGLIAEQFYNLANTLGGYVDVATPKNECEFMLKVSRLAAQYGDAARLAAERGGEGEPVAEWIELSDPASTIAAEVAALPRVRRMVVDVDDLEKLHGDIQGIADRVIREAAPQPPSPKLDAAAVARDRIAGAMLSVHMTSQEIDHVRAMNAPIWVDVLRCADAVLAAPQPPSPKLDAAAVAREDLRKANERLDEGFRVANALVESLPAHWHDDAVIEMRDWLEDEAKLAATTTQRDQDGEG